MVQQKDVIQELTCYHCGQPVAEEGIMLNDKSFCCQGCKTVYEILDENNLCEYYDLSRSPGVRVSSRTEDIYSYLDQPDIRRKVLTFDSERFARVTFQIPSIHCVSCIWLLENLHKLQPGVLRSEVNFARKTATIDFDPGELSLARLAACADSIGYAPVINLETEQKTGKANESGSQLVLRLAVAGFCFGNVMLLSFPEYLGIDKSEASLVTLFSYLNILLSIPVVVFSGRDYLVSAFRSFHQRQINIDVPIAAGILVLFVRSSLDVILDIGPGYFDSLTGLVFFLLIGRWFQSKTYDSLAFDRDFKSYFPLAVNKKEGAQWQAVVIYDLKPGDTIRVRNREIIPADCELISDQVSVDYSFVTGESKAVNVSYGETLYAGGRLMGQPAEMKLLKSTSQSHLVSLWNNAAFRKSEESKYQMMIDRIARAFTWRVLIIAAGAGVFWMWKDPSQTWLVITAVLMVACPCALALAAPFTYGNMMRIFGRHGLYLKNADILERMASVDAVVFDKTGTITHGKTDGVQWVGDLLPQEVIGVKALTQASTHPLSIILSRELRGDTSGVTMRDFVDIPGGGVEAMINNQMVRIGSRTFVDCLEKIEDESTKVFVAIDGVYRGYYSIGTSVRSSLGSLTNRIGNLFAGLLSGDNDSDRKRMEDLFGTDKPLLFNQSPHDKLEFVKGLQTKGRKVMMLGDGLNDAGALKQSDVGLAVSDDSGVFTPACDGILSGDKLNSLDQFLHLSRSARRIVKTGFGISFMYNIIAISVAVSGYLTPLIAAVLMPLSSISVVAFSSFSVAWVARKKL